MGYNDNNRTRRASVFLTSCINRRAFCLMGMEDSNE